MNGIIGFSELLAGSGLSEDKVRFYSKVIVESSHQLLHILDDLLDISKIEAGSVNLSFEEMNVNDMLNDLFLFYNPMTDNKEISLYLHKPLRNEQCIISSDPKRLRQVFTNLLSNAFKFTLNGSIRFGYERMNDHFHFFVQDTGVGICANNKKKIFERFWQEESRHTRNFGGTGLGLSISQKLVEIMGGEIWVESEKGKGAVFYFTIPVFSDCNHPQDVLLKKNMVDHLESITILVAEDEEINFMLVEEILAGEDVKIIHARNGVEAVDLFKKNHVDMVLMDLKMPLMDGYQALEAIRKIDPESFVVALTAYALPEEKEKGRKSGFNHYLVKPLKKDLLLGIINEQKQSRWPLN